MSKDRFREATTRELPDNPTLYTKHRCDSVIEIEESEDSETRLIRTTTYRPTLKGMQILADYYCKKYGINIFIHPIEDEHAVFSAENVAMSLRKFLEESTDKIEENLTSGTEFGVVLCRDCHTVPILISKDSTGKKVILILDSIASETKEEYSKITTSFPDYDFFINRGSRQGDRISCRIDAIAILKDALRIPRLADITRSRIVTDEPLSAPSKEQPSETLPPITRDGGLGLDLEEEDLEVEETSPNPIESIDGIAAAEGYASSVSAGSASAAGAPATECKIPDNNFYSFFLPEELLKTAQVSDFVASSKPRMDKIITTTKGKTLEEKRSESTKIVKTIAGDQSRNLYLLIKSHRFAETILEKIMSMEGTPATIVETSKTDSEPLREHDKTTVQSL